MRTNKVILPIKKELIRDKTRQEFIERIEKLELYVRKFQQPIGFSERIHPCCYFTSGCKI